MKLLLSLLFLTLLSFNLYSGSFDSDVKKAREMKSEEVVKCNPTGKNDGIAPILAFKKLKPGMTIELTPRIEKHRPEKGWPAVVIPNDKIIITSDLAKGRINYPVVVQGSGCVVRNANLQNLRLGNAAIVVDSILGSVSAGNEKGRGNTILYNSIVRSFGTGGGKVDVEMKNCTSTGSIRCKTNLKLEISDSVLFSEQVNFRFYDYHNKKGRLTLNNNIIYGNAGYAKMEESPSSKKMGVVCLEAKDMKKLWSVVFQGQNIYEAPKFAEYSTLTEDSPGKGKGIIPEEHSVIKALKKLKEDEAAERKKNRDEAAEKRKEEKDKRRDDAREKRRPRRKKPRAETPEKDHDSDNDDFGGAPEPPK